MGSSKVSKNKKHPTYFLLLLVVITVAGVVVYLKTLGQSSNSTFSTTSQITTTIRNVGPYASKHVIVIAVENKNESSVVGSPDAPYINNVLIPNYATAGNYFALGHPSLPNYLAMTSGSTYKLTTNYYPVASLNTTNLVDLFSKQNITWKAYMESMPYNNQSHCAPGLYDSGGAFGYGYVHRHNPFVYYKDIVYNATRCSDIVPMTNFYTDLASNSLPQFSFISANLLDSGHTTPADPTRCQPSGTSVQCTDIWLSGLLPKIMNNKVFSNTTIFIVWDEAEHLNASNWVLLIVVSPHAKKGFVEQTTYYDHFSLLATIEKIYNLDTLGRNDSTANTMNNLFINNTLP